MDFKTLRNQCILRTKCELSKTRTNVVFGTGNPKAEVMFIGEAPGKNEDEQALPFVGRSGQLLDKYMALINLQRDKNIFITNIVKCRPPLNRDPMAEEWDACIPYLNKQLEIIKPKIVVCLGRIAAQRIINPKLQVTKEHGVFFEKNSVLFMATLHPAALLRNPNNKPIAMQDFEVLKNKILQICTHTY